MGHGWTNAIKSRQEKKVSVCLRSPEFLDQGGTLLEHIGTHLSCRLLLLILRKVAIYHDRLEPVSPAFSISLLQVSKHKQARKRTSTLFDPLSVRTWLCQPQELLCSSTEGNILGVLMFQAHPTRGESGLHSSLSSLEETVESDRFIGSQGILWHHKYTVWEFNLGNTFEERETCQIQGKEFSFPFFCLKVWSAKFRILKIPKVKVRSLLYTLRKDDEKRVAGCASPKKLNVLDGLHSTALLGRGRKRPRLATASVARPPAKAEKELLGRIPRCRSHLPLQSCLFYHKRHWFCLTKHAF